MELFSSDAKMFFAHENMKKKLTPKVAHWPIFFRIASFPKISPNLIFYSMKMASFATSI